MSTDVIIMLVLLVISVIATGCLIVAHNRKDEKKSYLKVLMIFSICVLFGSIAYLSVAAATGQLIPKKTVEVFDPHMNGYHEEVEAENGYVYTGDFLNGYYNGEGTVKYTDGSTYVGEWKQGKRDGYVQSGLWKDDNYMG